MAHDLSIKGLMIPFQYLILNNLIMNTIRVSNIVDVKLNPNLFVLKIVLDGMQKHSSPCVIHFHKVPRPKSPEEHNLRLSKLYMS